MKILKFMEKATEEFKMFERALRSWLAFSEMTKKDLLEYKTAKKIYAEKTSEGCRLMCVKDGHREQIGCGLSKDSTADIGMLFMYAGAVLDYANNFKTFFSNEILQSLKE